MIEKKTPVKAVRAFCVDCVGGLAHHVKDCGGDKCLNGGSDAKGVCWLYKYRMGAGRPSVKLIRKYCLFCQGERQDFVAGCSVDECAFHPYRMGRNPSRAGMGNVGNFFLET